MRTDLELVRRILLNANEATEPFEIECLVDSANSRAKVGKHVRMLMEDGYVDAGFTSGDDFPYYSVMVRSLTPKGRDLAVSMQSDDIWDGVKRKLVSVGGTVAVSVLGKLLQKAMEAKLGL